MFPRVRLLGLSTTVLAFALIHCLGESFQGSQTFNGYPLCAVGSPSYATIATDEIFEISIRAPNTVRCAYRCTAMVKLGRPCFAFNAIGNQCQFYNGTTNLCYAASTTCSYNQVTCVDHNQGCTKPQITTTIVPADSCSLPFTLNGALNYQCTANRSSATCDIGCFVDKRKWATCTFESLGFIAANTTVITSIQSTNVPLKSVNGWLFVMSRVDSRFPLAQSWSSYRTGFGEVESNFWLGLEPLYQLTNSAVNGRKTFRVRFLLQSYDDGRWFSQDYDWFFIESEATSYTLRMPITGVGDAGDAINSGFNGNETLSNGMPFSSMDADRDFSSDNCAMRTGGGWWHNKCGSGRLLGSLTADFSGYLWRELKTVPGQSGRLDKSYIMIMPTD